MDNVCNRCLFSIPSKALFICEGTETASVEIRKVVPEQLRNGKCLACVHPIRDARGLLGEHEGSVRDARGAAESISRIFSHSRRFWPDLLLSAYV